MTRNELLLEILVGQLSQVPPETMIKNFIDDFILDKNHLLQQRIYK